MTDGSSIVDSPTLNDEFRRKFIGLPLGPLEA